MSKPLLPKFIQTQYTFANYLRHQDLKDPLPAGIDNAGVKLYRELMYYTMEDLIAATFPVLKTIIAETDWEALIKDFIAVHRATTPYFPEVPQEFLVYLQNERDTRNDPPFLFELAHYEWTEMVLNISNIKLDPIFPVNPHKIDNIILTCSPLAWVMQYKFPVQNIRLNYQPIEAPAQPTFLCVYRNQALSVKFMELEALSARLLNLLSENKQLTCQQVLEQLAVEAQAQDLTSFMLQGQQRLQNFLAENIVYCFG